MRLDDDGDRSDVEDRRGDSPMLGGALGGSGVRLGLGGTVVVLILSVVLKQDLFSMLGSGPAAVQAPRPAPSAAQVQRRTAGEADLEKIAVASFNDTQRTWERSLAGRYRHAKLVLFWDATRSGCGAAESAMGPFYCPADQRVYIDLGFYRELATRFGAPGAFAQAYVIAHEVGHHVQDVLGIERKVREAQRQNPRARNALSVRMELQADCFAGVWGHAARERGLLDAGDLEAGLGAAAAVGDDRLQKAATGRVVPESFTHGSSAQRAEWFRRGFESGDPKSCDTFAAKP
jgi:predicted metalloprotease